MNMAVAKMKMRQSGQLIGFLLQSIAAGLAIAFIVLYFFPGSLPGRVNSQPADADSLGRVSYRDAVSLAAPSVVNVYASTLRTRKPHPLFQDPLFRQATLFEHLE